MHLHALDYVLWLSSTCLQAGVLVAMHRRALHRVFPYFYLYTVVQVISAPLLIVLMFRASFAAYYYVYWIVAFVCVLIAFALIKELFESAFQQFAAIRDLGSRVFRWALLVVVFATIAMAVSNRVTSGPSAMHQSILMADRSGRIMLCALAVLLLAGSRYLRISRRSTLFGIALGFAIFSMTKVIIETILLRSPHLGGPLSQLNSFAYCCAGVVWLLYCWFGEVPQTLAATATVRVERKTSLWTMRRPSPAKP